MFPKFQKTILRLLVVLLICAPFYSAHGNHVAATKIYLPVVLGSDTWSAVDPSGQTIVFWHQHSRERETALQEIATEFNVTNPWQITVIPEYQGGYGDIFNKMLTVLNTPEAPDLVIGYQNQLATYQVSNALVDLTALVDSESWGLSSTEKDDFFPGIYDQDIYPTFNHQRLGFPPSRSMEILYYNVDWLGELGYSSPPTTTAQFQEMTCTAINHPFTGAIGGESMGYMLSVDASRFASWVFAFGGDLYDTGNLQYTLNTPEAIAAMTFLQGLFDLSCARMIVERYEDQTKFGTGELLFAIGSSSGLPYYQFAVDEGAQFTWNSGILPHTTADPVMNVYGASISVPTHTPERALAAWLFLKHFTTPEVQADWARATNYYPVRASVADSLAEYFVENPQYANVFANLVYGKTEPPIQNYAAVRDMIEEAMVDIMEGADVVVRLNQLDADANALP